MFQAAIMIASMHLISINTLSLNSHKPNQRVYDPIKQPITNPKSYTTPLSFCLITGAAIKVFQADISNETIAPPVAVRALLTQTVQEMKSIIGQALDVPPSRLRCVLEKYHIED